MPQPSPWTPEKITILKTAWEAGETAAAIAKRLDIGKNAVIGKVHRLGLQGRPSPIRRDGAPAPRKTAKSPVNAPASAAIGNRIPAVAGARSPRPKPANIEVAVSSAPAALNPKILCDYPLWNDDSPRSERGTKYCAKPSLAGSNYCPEHAARCFVKTRAPLSVLGAVRR